MDQAAIDFAVEQFVAADAELCRRSLKTFVREAWHIIEPSAPYVHGRHIDAICDHLEAVYRGQITRLVINIPPGHMKSLLTSIFWPAWVWSNDPSKRFIFASYSDTNVRRDSIKMKSLLKSEWYRERFPNIIIDSDKPDIQDWYFTTAGGFRFATTVGGPVTGHHAHYQLVDDPISAEEIYSEAARARNIRWWDETMPSRMLPDPKAARVVIMQRLHEDDLSGHVLKTGKYDHLCLPAEFEPERVISEGHRDYIPPTGIGFVDWRTEPGELLWPELFTEEILNQRQVGMTAYAKAGQYQQRPAPAEGGLIKRAYFKYYRRSELPAKFDVCEICVDATFDKDGKNNDYVAMSVWGSKGADSYLLHMVRRKMNYPETKAALRQLIVSWPRATRRRIEKKANGAALIAELRSNVTGLIPYEPRESKVSRVNACLPQFESGNVHVPHPDECEWVDEYITELISFPNASHDDMVDATTMYLIHRVASNLEYFKSMATL